MRKVIFLLCLLTQTVSAQHGKMSVSFCSGTDKINFNGGDFINQDSINFYDHSTGKITKWKWEFDGAENPVLEYDKFRPVVSAKWKKDGRYKVKLTTFNSKGDYSTFGVTIYVKFISTEPEEKKQKKDYLSLFVGPTAEFIFPTQKGNSNETFLGGMSGLIIKPHSKWTSNITVGYFLEHNIGSSVSKKFSGLYTNIMVPVSKKGHVMFGPTFRVGKYVQGSTKGFAKAFGLQMNYLPNKTLTPKGPIDMRLQIASAVEVFNVSDVSGSLTVLFDFGLR